MILTKKYPTSPEDGDRVDHTHWKQPNHSRQLQYTMMGNYSVAELEAEIDEIVINWRESNPRINLILRFMALLINIWDEMSEGDHVHFRTY